MAPRRAVAAHHFLTEAHTLIAGHEYVHHVPSVRDTFEKQKSD